MRNKDFSKWFYYEINWGEVAWGYNTGRKYQAKQDLVSIFWNSYISYEQKLKTYYNEFNDFPFDYVNELIFKFRQHFPKNGRAEGVNYFDDLLVLLIDKYKTQIDFTKNSEPLPPPQEQNNNNEVKENLHNGYFKGNTFLLFKKYCNKNNVDNTNRTDLSVLFQLFKENNFFVDTMELKHYLKFLSDYLDYNEIELKKANLKAKPNIKRTNDFNQIKDNLKLTLK
jgi:hypothetical protein